MSNDRRGVIIVYALLGLSSVLGCRGPKSLGPHEFSFPDKTCIAHALGSIKGRNYTNSAEAFERSLARGARFFEVDLSFTADGDLVCFHTNHEKHLAIETPVTEISTAAFLDLRYDGVFTLMELETLLRRLAPLPETYVITDCKHDFSACMEKVLATAETVHPDLVGRIIPQFYTADQWRDVARMEAAHGPFATVIFTLYRAESSDDAVVKLTTRRSIPVVTMSKERFNLTLVRRLADEGIDAMIHTVNTPEDIISYVDRGACGVYSDRFFTWRSVQEAADLRQVERSRSLRHAR